LNKDDENFSKEDALNWINDSVQAFCNTHSSKFQEYIKKLEETP